ncbi:hypothetical protein ACF09H_20700 [Streptomyces sp. NPDC014983]|uniref:hypothetical protein n=1 Tax=Streptomyces sp. NPDC014983 TaxID=3364933 RepID=UPI0036F4F03A
MTDDEIRSRFDGRGLVEIRGGESIRARAEPIAHALGYRLVSTETHRPATSLLGYRGPATLGLFFRRDDDPRARRRAEQAIERLRAGGPLLVEGESAVPPPPPRPAPPLVPRPPAPRPRRSLEPPPPPPVPATPPGPRVPPLPPPPPPPPSA